jgi:hypothetical protein
LDGTIATADLANNSVDGSKIALTGQATGDLSYYNGTDWITQTIGTAGQALTVNGTADGFVYANVLTNTLNDNTFLLGNGSNIATAVTLTGDVTSTNA